LVLHPAFGKCFKKDFFSLFSDGESQIDELSPDFHEHPELLTKNGPAGTYLLRIDVAEPVTGPVFELAAKHEKDIDELMSIWHRG